MQRCSGGLGACARLSDGGLDGASDPGVCSDLRLGPYSGALWGLLVAVEGTACSWELNGS